VGPQAAQPQRATVGVLVGVRGDHGGAGGAVRVPQAHRAARRGEGRAMNLFVTDPDWGWWIILYFYFGGIAAGAYFTATLTDLLGSEEDRELPRIGYSIACPLVWVCALMLTVDLGRPERFWHMFFKSEVVDAAFAAGWPWSAAGWGE